MRRYLIVVIVTVAGLADRARASANDECPRRRVHERAGRAGTRGLRALLRSVPRGVGERRTRPHEQGVPGSVAGRYARSAVHLHQDHHAGHRSRQPRRARLRGPHRVHARGPKSARGQERTDPRHGRRIQFVGPEGPQPLPNLTIVRAVGCLSAAANESWELDRASSPRAVRSRIVDGTTPDELKASAAQALGHPNVSADERQGGERVARGPQGAGEGRADEAENGRADQRHDARLGGPTCGG